MINIIDFSNFEIDFDQGFSLYFIVEKTISFSNSIPFTKFFGIVNERNSSGFFLKIDFNSDNNAIFTIAEEYSNENESTYEILNQFDQKCQPNETDVNLMDCRFAVLINFSISDMTLTFSKYDDTGSFLEHLTLNPKFVPTVNIINGHFGYYLLKSSSNTRKIKNFYYFRKQLSLNDSEKYFGSIAELLWAVYLYLEPEQTPLFRNRSKMNFMPAINGRLDMKQQGLEGRFDGETKRVSFFMYDIGKHVVFLPTQMFEDTRFNEISVFISMNIFSNVVTLSEYLNGNGSSSYVLFEILLDSGAFIRIDHSISKAFIVPLQSFRSRFRIIFFDGSGSFPMQRDCLHKAFNATYNQLNLSFIKIKIIKRNSSNKTQVILESDNQVFNPPLVSEFDLTWGPITSVTIGSEIAQSSALNESPFIYEFFDIQIFSGSVFFTDENNNMLAVNRMDTHYVKCQGNPYLLRP
jgi:hypothetical protein